MPALLPIVLLVAMATQANAVCQRLFIKGLDPAEFPFAQSHEGVYKLHPKTDPEKTQYPLYVHETRNMVIQIYSQEYILFRPIKDTTLPRLSIRIKPGYNIISWLNKRQHKHPFRKIVEEWRYHYDVTGKFHVLDADLQIECAEDDMFRCSANMLRFSHSVTRKIDGETYWAVESNEEFVHREGEYLNQRPVYYSIMSDSTLFYTNEHWVVSSSVGRDPIMRVRDNAYLPEYISAFWEVSNRHFATPKWKIRRHLRLICTESIEDVIGNLASWCSEETNPCQHDGSCFQREDHREELSYCLCQGGYSGTLCENAQQKCPLADFTDIGVQHVAYEGSAENQTIGDIAVMHCNKHQYFTSVCALNDNREAVWRPDNRVRCSLGPSSSTDSETPGTSEAMNSQFSSQVFSKSLHTAEPMVEQSSSVATYEVAQSVVTSPNNITDIMADEVKSGLSSTCRRWFVAFLLLGLVFVYPVYLFLQRRTSKCSNGYQQLREAHIRNISELYDLRDQSLESLRTKYPGLVFSKGTGVFIKDNGKHTELEKRDIAAEYHRIYGQCASDIHQAEVSHQEALQKVKNKKTWNHIKYVTYCYTILIVGIIYILLNVSLQWEHGGWKDGVIMSILTVYSLLLSEAFGSLEAQSLFSMKRGTITEYLDALKQEQPLLIMGIEVFRQNLKVHLDETTNGKYTTECKQHKVVTSNHYCSYDYTAWKDISAEFIQSDPCAIYSVTMSKKIEFSDPSLYEQHCQEMKQNYSKPNHSQNFSLSSHIENFEHSIVICGDRTPWWLKSKLLYFITSLFMASWFLRRQIKNRMIPIEFTIRKTVLNVRGNVAVGIKYDKEKAAKDTVKVVNDLEAWRKREQRGKKTMEKKPIVRNTEVLHC